MLIKRALTSLLDLRIRRECRKKKRLILQQAHRNYPAPAKSTLIRYRDLWRPLAGSPDPFYCSIYKEINGVESNCYVPEYEYYRVIEPTMNNLAFSLAYADKSFYCTLTGRADIFPETPLKGTAGTVYDEHGAPVIGAVNLIEYLSVGRSYVLKPATDSAGGRGVKLVRVVSVDQVLLGNDTFSSDSFREMLRMTYRNNFVIQIKIEQHPWLSAFNETSVNTVRMMTCRIPSTETVVCLRSVLRFGMPGSIVDNQASGGLSCGIDGEGRVNDFAIDKYGRRTLVDAGGDEVPGFHLMKDAAVDIGRKYPYHRILGFDFCVDKSGEVRLLEVNTKNLEINFIQMNSGPLLGRYTEEIIDFCLVNPKTIVLDWTMFP